MGSKTGQRRRPSMASPLPLDDIDQIERYIVSDEEFESLQNFDWSSVNAEILNDLDFITKLPQLPVLDYAALGPLLPPKASDAPSKTLFIDLDETLVHTSLGDPFPGRSHDLSFVSGTDGSVQARVYFRPWASDFLRIMAQYYELVLYTASVKLYADIILDELDVDKCISFRLYRDHCTQYGDTEIYFKDLNGTGRRLEDAVLIDNRLISFGLNVRNGIFVSSFTNQPHDTELLHLLPILVALSKQEDVRLALEETYRLPEIVRQYKREGRVGVDVARSLNNIGTPRAHRLNQETGAIHVEAITTIGTMSYRDNLCDESTDDEGDHNENRSQDDALVSSLSSADKTSRQASVSGSRHMAALTRFSNNRDSLASPRQPSREIIISRDELPVRQPSMRRLTLPPKVPERRKKQSNPFKNIDSLSSVTFKMDHRPKAPKPLYKR